MKKKQKIDVLMRGLMQNPQDCPSASRREAIAVVLSEFFALGERLESIAASLHLIAHPMRAVDELKISMPDQEP